MTKNGNFGQKIEIWANNRIIIFSNNDSTTCNRDWLQANWYWSGNCISRWRFSITFRIRNGSYFTNNCRARIRQNHYRLNFIDSQCKFCIVSFSLLAEQCCIKKNKNIFPHMYLLFFLQLFFGLFPLVQWFSCA